MPKKHEAATGDAARRKRPSSYMIKRTDVLISADALELVDAGLKPEEVRRKLIRRLVELAKVMQRLCVGKDVDPSRAIAAHHAARLLTDQEPGDLLKAAEEVKRLEENLRGMTRQAWHERLSSLTAP